VIDSIVMFITWFYVLLPMENKEIQKMLDKKLDEIVSDRKKEYVKISKKETKLALVNFALQNYERHDYDAFQVSVDLPFPFSPRQEFEVKRRPVSYSYPEKYLDLIEYHLDEDWYYRLKGLSKDELSLLIHYDSEFKNNLLIEAKNLFEKYRRLVNYKDKLSELTEAGSILSGRLAIFKTENHFRIFGDCHLYNVYDGYSKDEKSHSLFLETTSGKELANGLYEINLAKKKSVYGYEIFEIMDAKIIAQDSSASNRGDTHYSRGDIAVWGKMFREELGYAFHNFRWNIKTFLVDVFVFIIAVCTVLGLLSAVVSVISFLTSVSCYPIQ